MGQYYNMVPYSCPSCPKCGGFGCMEKIAEGKGGFSVGKAAAGAVLLGPLGLAGGALGKKQTTWRCLVCGYMLTK